MRPWYRPDVPNDEAASSITARIVLSTFPTLDNAAEVGRVLVTERLAACVNLVPTVRSIYRWQDAVHDETETLAIIKTTVDRLAALAARLVELHPYDVPEVVALPVVGGHAPYLAWITDSTK
ncbi:MAG: divalent-cation tolerance protein CutA [Deltaproteobacteria bacterium]|nr:divalent-cation tolerance protein CutA [Deltaproteobacteria bacterium]